MTYEVFEDTLSAAILLMERVSVKRGCSLLRNVMKNAGLRSLGKKPSEVVIL